MFDPRDDARGRDGMLVEAGQRALSKARANQNARKTNRRSVSLRWFTTSRMARWPPPPTSACRR
jgi:hypothetical protein